MAHRFGVVGAFRLARALDVIAVACVVSLGFSFGLGWPYFAGCIIAAALLVYKHTLVSPDDLSRFGMAFFRINAYVSTSVFTGTLVALLLQ